MSSSQDLDTFLASIESKLRGPFSSLDLAKVISTDSLRGSLSAAEYLDRVSQVISRTDKITQTRMNIALLGLDPAEDTDSEIVRILEQTQEAPLHEEWVRVVSCLVQGIMFEDENGNPKRGKEANKLLKKTCKEILQRIKRLDFETGGLTEEPSRLATANADPLFAPLRYALLKPELLQQVIPETQENPHFTVNETADVLLMDTKLEVQKANEAEEHGLLQSMAKKTTTSTVKSGTTKQSGVATFPGMKSAAAKKAAARGKSSMFMPAKKPQQVLAARAKAGGAAKKVGLHTRKAGAAQALLAKGRARMKANAAGGGSVGGASKLGAARAKLNNQRNNNKKMMMMLDVSEVQDLNKDQQNREVAEKKKPGRKRKADLAGGARAVKIKKTQKNGHHQQQEETPKKAPPPEPEPEEDQQEEAASPAPVAADTANNQFLLAAALSKYQAQVATTTTQESPQSPAPTIAAPAAPPAAESPASPSAQHRQLDWHALLQQHSNKLTDADRLRIQQFFDNRYNPTPDQLKYKCKLHEERGTDPKTGQPVKQTFYLELDYTNFTSKQSKKVKRYN